MKGNSMKRLSIALLTATMLSTPVLAQETYPGQPDTHHTWHQHQEQHHEMERHEEKHHEVHHEKHKHHEKHHEELHDDHHDDHGAGAPQH
jgi:Ni/Co efflux regulator RcnB